MPLRKADSIYMADTGRKMTDQDIEFIMGRLVAFGKMSSNWPTTAHGQYVYQTLAFLIHLNSTLPRPFDPWFLVMQTWHETGGYTSSYLTEDGNLAGIGIWADGIPSPWDGKLNPEEAARVYLLELVAHAGTEDEFDSVAEKDSQWKEAAERDRVHLTKLWNLRHSVSWPTVRFIHQLNDPVPPWDYVWAKDALYPEKIEGVASDVAPNIPNTKGGSMAVNIGNRPLRIAIGAGHRNNSGGNEWETAMTAKCTKAVIDLARVSKGFEIRSYTPNDGLGWFNGPLDAAARTVVTWLNQGWAADILHELHFEGLGNSSVRGGHYIYPDSAGLIGRNPGNVDEDVKAVAGPMAKALVSEFGGVCRYSGCNRGMSEKETGVGGQGFRLGVFGAWAEPYFNGNSFQFISEGSTYTNPDDLRIMQAPGFPERHAIGILKGYALIAKQRGNWTYPYVIGAGGGTDPIPVPNPAPDGQSYPAGFDDGIMRLIFGSLVSGGRTYRFNPKGTISRAWYSHYKANQNWPRLVWHFLDEQTGREYFGFGNGEILWRPGKGSGYRWAS